MEKPDLMLKRRKERQKGEMMEKLARKQNVEKLYTGLHHTSSSE